jgi:hypothetical protein
MTNSNPHICTKLLIVVFIQPTHLGHLVQNDVKLTL